MDPITMSLLAAQGIAGLGKTGYGLYQQNAGKAGLAGVQEASRMKPAEYAEMLKEAKSGQAVQQRIDAINKSLQTSTEALQQSGSRAVIGGIGKVVDAGTGATNQLLGQQQRDIMSALGASAMGSERQIGRDTQREMIQRQGFQNAVNAGVQNTVSGIADIGSTLGYAANLNEKKPDENTFNFDFGDEIKKAMLTEEEQRQREEQEAQRTTAEHGMKVTPGEFSHDTNPIHMIQDGEVIGEMTGGEYVLNPQQAKAISKESKFFRNLLKTKRFK